MTSPTQRSLKFLRDQGFPAQVVEKWNPYAKVRIDLFNFIDIVAVTPKAIVGVQATTQQHAGQAERLEKVRGSKVLTAWLEAGGRLAIHGWAKRGARGKRKTWTVLEREVTLEDLMEPIETDPERQDRRSREVDGRNQGRIGTPGNGVSGLNPGGDEPKGTEPVGTARDGTG